MNNLAMQRAIDDGDALDVQHIGTEVEPGVFELRSFEDAVDYCDSDNERWIWSIGRELTTGRVLAAYDTRFYQHPDFTCLWLR